MRYLITGGTGSLGHALVARLSGTDGVQSITVYSRDEVKQSEMKHKYPNVRYMLGDVRDYDRLQLAMLDQDVVIHAAAYKQVPSAEANVDEAIATNVQGSLNVARAAVHADVMYVVGVSTDKACAPINAYGQTKALMERLFQQANGWGNTAFNCVRYGNVIGSRGSVVPLFREQARKGCYTLTDPEMTRFWMTLDQAVDLVLKPINNVHVVDGATLVARCKASTMLDMLVACHTAFRGGDSHPEYKVIGTRPGEKKHESLIHANESLHTLQPSDELPYYQIMPAHVSGDVGEKSYDYRSDSAPQLDVDELIEMVREASDA